MDLSKTNNNELKEKLDLLNNRPKKGINYKTPNEVIEEFLLNCCTWIDKLSQQKKDYFLVFIIHML